MAYSLLECSNIQLTMTYRHVNPVKFAIYQEKGKILLAGKPLRTGNTAFNIYACSLARSLKKNGKVLL
ncbi:MAG: hypothetical protein CEE38_06025 [Planctomycetes bacterium B3_Pla]|nr:MAG: hypothetical protein CEE38_06025 [Planctomycetes bacterium B3_Pla]